MCFNCKLFVESYFLVGNFFINCQIPLSLQVPALKHATPFLSFLEEEATYSFLANINIVSKWNITIVEQTYFMVKK